MTKATDLPTRNVTSISRMAERIRRWQEAERQVAAHRGRKRQQGKTVPRICQHCGGDFFASRSQVKKGRGRFCCRRCYGDAMLARRPRRICPHCGISFAVPPSYPTKVHCSRRCNEAANPLWKRGRWWPPDGMRRCTDPLGRHTAAGESPVLPRTMFTAQGPYLSSQCRDCRRDQSRRYIRDRYHHDAEYRRRCIERAADQHRREKAARDARRDRVPALIAELVVAGWQVTQIAEAIGSRRSTLNSWKHCYVRPEMAGVEKVEALWAQVCGSDEMETAA